MNAGHGVIVMTLISKFQSPNPREAPISKLQWKASVVLFSSRSFSVNARENQMKLFGLQEEFARLISEFRFSSRDHAKKESSFFGLFGAARNTIAKILLGNPFI